MPESLSERVSRRWQAKQAASKLGLSNIEIMTILGNEGLSNLGKRSGKAGVFFGIKGSSRMVSVGRRDVLRNVFLIMIHRPDQLKRPDTRWEMYTAVNKSKLSEVMLRNWAKWAREGITTKQLRGEARHLWLKKRDDGEAEPIVILTGETKR